MPAVMIAMNALFAVIVVGGAVALFLHGIATQHRDHGVQSSGSFLRRRVWSHRARPHAGPVRPWVVRRGQAWPAA
jgi:hypothetical protein